MSVRADMSRFRIDDRVSVLIIASDYLVVILIALLSIAANSTLLTCAAIVLIAGRQAAFLNLVHAAAHYSLFSKKRANDSVDFLVGYPIFDAVAPYRVYHLEHHREIALKTPNRFDQLRDQLPEPGSGFWRRTWVVVVKQFLGAAGVDFVRAVVSQCQENPVLARRLTAYWLGIIGAFFWAGWLKYLLLYWFLPLVWLYPVFYFWAEISDHYAAKDESRNQRGLFYSLFIKGHEMYHAVHHLYPRIPFYRIEAANRHLGSLGVTMEESRGIADFVRILYSSGDEWFRLGPDEARQGDDPEVGGAPPGGPLLSPSTTG